MISMTWIYIMLLMLAGSFILQMVPLLIYFPAVLIVNILIFREVFYQILPSCKCLFRTTSVRKKNSDTPKNVFLL